MGPGRTIFKACRCCRRKRARCDGELPCQRCTQWKSECVYDKRPGETKAKLRHTRDELQSYNDAASIFFDTLASTSDDAALIALWRREPIDQIASKLIQTQGDAGLSCDESQQVGGHHQHGPYIPDDDFAIDDSSDPPSASTRASQLDATGLPPLVDRPPTQRDGTLVSSPDEGRVRSSRASFGLQRAPDGLCTSDGTSTGSTYGDLLSLVPKVDQTPSESSFLTPANVDALPASEDLGKLLMDGIRHGGDLEELPYEFVHDCIDTFFSWQYLPFPMIDKPLFMRDFLDGNHSYCSSALVRSISCLACRIRGGFDASQSADAHLGDTLFSEAIGLLKSNRERAHCLPDVQALGLLSLHQLGLGEYQGARELADESVRRVDAMHHREIVDDDGDPVFRNTFYGSISLARIIRLTIGYISGSASSSRRGPLSMNWSSKQPGEIDARVEQLLSLPPPTYVGQPPAGVRHVPTGMFQLTGWVYGFSSRYPIQDGDQLPHHLRDTYRACLSWYASALGSAHDRQDAGPFVHLFLPFRHVPCADSEVSPVALCAESAEAILGLAKTCNHLDRRHASCFVPLFVYAAGLADVAVTRQAQAAATTRTRGGSVGGGGVGSACGCSGDEVLDQGQRLTKRAIDQLTIWGEAYPSALKAASQLQEVLSR